MAAAGSFETPLTVAQLQQLIGNAVRVSPPGRGVWVVAELVDVRTSGGHLYMELIEKNATGATVAKIKGNLWRNRLPYLRQKFFAATGSDIRSGLKVLLGGTATHHPLYGISFNVEDIDPSYTLGDMERLRREILRRLESEGILTRNKELPMPPAPQKIAVISAPGAAGYGDFIDQLTHNPDGLQFYPVLFEATLQGDRTSLSVREALARIEMSVDVWDCVAIVRGGGATTDLNGFDDYELARAVALFPLPVVVGIGHERDRTVLDEIANTRIKTPTGVAAFFVDRARDALAQACSLVDRITRHVSDIINGEHRHLTQLAGMIPALASARIDTARASLASTAGMIPTLAAAHIHRARASLTAIAASLPPLARTRTSAARTRLQAVSDNLLRAPLERLRAASAALEALEAVTMAYSPDNTLRRGYSITMLDGKALRSPSQAPPGSTVVTRLADGSLHSRVIPAPDQTHK